MKNIKSHDKNDLERLTRQLMNLSNAWDDTAVNLHLELISKFLHAADNSLEDLLRVHPISKALRNRFVQLKNLLTGVRDINEEIKHRANIVLQTVS